MLLKPGLAWPGLAKDAAIRPTLHIYFIITHISSRHVEGLGCRVDDLVDGLH